MSDDLWGPWILHDGKSIPTAFNLGDYVQVCAENNETGALQYGERVICPKALERHNWFWGESAHDTLRYRIRRPRGMAYLDAMLTNLPAPSKQGERV